MAKFEHIGEKPPLFWIALVETNKLEKPARVRACSMVAGLWLRRTGGMRLEGAYL